MDLYSQLLEATVEVHFIPRDPAATAVFELHNALHVDAVEASDGSSLNPIRYRQDSTVQVSFPETLPVDQPQSIRFRYGGRLTGLEDSPVEGYSLAEITAERAILLYAGRWFRSTAMARTVLQPTFASSPPRVCMCLAVVWALGAKCWRALPTNSSSGIRRFPGTIAIVQEDPVQVTAGNASSAVYMPGTREELALGYGEAAAEMVEFYSDLFGAPYSKSLSIIEMGEYAPNGYWSPGLVLLSPYGRKENVNHLLLGKLVANQWWGSLVGAGNRNHLWLVDGLAQYSSLLNIEETEGEEAFLNNLSDTRIEALTFDTVPLRQSSRVLEFSPQMNALTSARGAMVLHMLRWRVGDEAFFGTLRELVSGHTWGSQTTDSFRERFEDVTGKDLDGFFLQWTESNVTPEFKQEYTIYRLEAMRASA